MDPRKHIANWNDDDTAYLDALGTMPCRRGRFERLVWRIRESAPGPPTVSATRIRDVCIRQRL